MSIILEYQCLLLLMNNNKRWKAKVNVKCSCMDDTLTRSLQFDLNRQVKRFKEAYCTVLKTSKKTQTLW